MKLRTHQKVMCCGTNMIISRIIYHGNIDNIEKIILYDGVKEFLVKKNEIDKKIEII